jgi:quinate dehydrogenase (quinone)
VARVKAALAIIFGLLLILVALPLMWLGVQLVAAGGSPYYAPAGIALAASGLLYVLRRGAGLTLLLLTVLATVPWALWEAGLDFWPLFARLFAPVVLLVIGALVAMGLPKDARFTGRPGVVAGIAGVVALLFVAGMFREHGVIRPAAPAGLSPVAADADDWSHYGRTAGGTRFAPAAQITPENVGELRRAWTLRTGDAGIGELLSEDQNTPLQVGDTLFACTRNNRVFALDVDTGAVRWRFDPKPVPPPLWRRCRSLGYHARAAEDAPADRSCPRRILMTTIDNRLIALDAATGRLCPGFGKDGTVDLAHQMGPLKPGYLIPSSGPTVIGRIAMVGAWVFDNQEVAEPSGVVRAYDVETGALVWAWDMGAPDRIGAPPEGEIYTPGTPNMWSVPSFDAKLGLVYLPMGNQTPDFWGADRSAAAEKYSAAVVALDITTGRPRWVYRTVLHDLWDYDVPAQPVLYDLPDGKGGITPLLVQITKQGDIFLLDRRNGRPVSPVTLQRVPQGGQSGEALSPVQPRSTGMPSIGNATLVERDMWGATPLDQLVCRLTFRRARYEGLFTPVTTDRWTLQFPGYYGGMNWGSAAINHANDYLIVNDLRLGILLRLVPQADVAKAKVPPGDHDGIGPQTGAPYAINRESFVSPLAVPCQKPPFGTMTAIDLKTRKIVWQRPLGTLRDTGPLGVATGLDIPIGMPSIGGAVTTASGLVFFAGTQDFYLRAIDVRDGRELWKVRLPVGAQATPMTYVSPRTGRQYVVVSAGGARRSPVKGDYLIAYALPRSGSGE